MERHIGFTKDKEIFVKVYRNPQGREDMQKCLDVIPEDVRAIVYDVLRHRIGITYEAEAENVTSVDIINSIINEIEVP